MSESKGPLLGSLLVPRPVDAEHKNRRGVVLESVLATVDTDQAVRFDKATVGKNFRVNLRNKLISSGFLLRSRTDAEFMYCWVVRGQSGIR